MLLMIACLAVLSSSCTGIMAGVTGQAPSATPVQREGGKPIQVATTDLLQAEAGPPETIHGLYDVAMVAAGFSKIKGDGK